MNNIEEYISPLVPLYQGRRSAHWRGETDHTILINCANKLNLQHPHQGGLRGVFINNLDHFYIPLSPPFPRGRQILLIIKAVRIK